MFATHGDAANSIKQRGGGGETLHREESALNSQSISNTRKHHSAGWMKNAGNTVPTSDSLPPNPLSQNHLRPSNTLIVSLGAQALAKCHTNTELLLLDGSTEVILSFHSRVRDKQAFDYSSLYMFSCCLVSTVSRVVQDDRRRR